ncbi:tetratricopeptide repeat protein [bacterium SCSIO 12741]|nr:tetratricopeptide repeat protein [bacterium SCSIO 12741]
MSKKNHEEKDEVIVDIGGTYNQVEQFIEKNKNVMVGGLVAIALVIGGFFAYNSFYLEPLQEEASNEIWRAQQYERSDSLEQALYGDGMYMGFEGISDDFGATNTGKLANYQMGLVYMRQGEYQLAIDAMDDFKSDDVMASAIALGVQGDAYMQLDDPDMALSKYIAAARRSPNNFTTPIFLKKAGEVAEALGDYSQAVSLYEEIEKDYKDTQEGKSIEKFLYRAKTRAANNG